MDWLVYLLCPLMMLPLFFFMIKGNRSDQGSKQQKLLSEELNQLKQHNAMMQEELTELKRNVH